MADVLADIQEQLGLTDDEVVEFVATCDAPTLKAIQRGTVGELGRYGRYAFDPQGFIEGPLGERLWSKQRDICQSVLDNKRTAVPACFGPGKAIRDGTPVLTPTGWQAVETLVPGQAIIAGDGTPAAVLGVYPQGHRELWRVTLSDGRWVDADADHLWTVLVRGAAGRKAGRWETLTTADMVRRWGEEPLNWNRVLLPTVGVVEFPERPVPLDPYLVGVLLGDGSLGQSTPRLTTADPELLDLIGFGGARPTKHRPLDYPLLGILDAVREAGIYGYRSHDKHVPDAYLWNAHSVRLAVLQGLMDTDGTVSLASGDVEFDSVSEKLADAVGFLARSLGGRVTRGTKAPHYTHLGERREGRLCYRVRLVMPAGVCPFRLTRKAEPWAVLSARRRTTTAASIVSIRPTTAGHATCIAVDHPSMLFVTKDFIVTHNTHLAARLVAWWVSAWPVGTSQVVTTATTFRTVKAQLWPHIRTVQDRHGLPGRTTMVEWKVGREMVAFGFSASDTDPEAVQGFHKSHLLVVVDEAGGISHAIGGALNSLMTGTHARLLAIGNPSSDEQDTWFEKVCASPEWNTIRIAVEDTPNFTGEDAGECRSCPRGVPPHPVASHLVDEDWRRVTVAEYGEGDPYVVAKVHAQFPEIVANRTIPLAWIDEANKLGRESPFTGTRVRLGVDIASDGGDEMAISRVVGMHGTVEHHESGRSLANSVDVAGIILNHIREAEELAKELGSTEKVRVKVDVIGLGWGPVSTLQRWGEEGMHGAEVVGVNVGEKAKAPDRFINQRAEMWWEMRELLQPQAGTGDKPAATLNVDTRTAKQLGDPTHKTSSGGRRQIESKALLRQRGRKSPDRAESLLLAFYEPPDDGESEVEVIV